MSSSEKPQPPDPPDVSGNGGTAGATITSQTDAIAGVAEKKMPAKKKKVSFKFALESSDDLHIVKKEPIASFAPPVPIIKKECLTRAIRIARGGESIIMPSRLTGLTQKFRNNTANNIDKLNSLTFKSQVTSTSVAAKSIAANDDVYTSDEEDSSSTNADETKRPLDTDDDAENDDGDKIDENDNGDADVNTDRDDKLGAKVTTANEDADDDETMNKSVPSADGKNATATAPANETVGGKNSGEKRFVLPKRSVHSSRVIKPNKRFMDETQASTKKNGIASRKKANKLEQNECTTRSESPPPQPPPSKSTTEDTDADANDGKFEPNCTMSFSFCMGIVIGFFLLSFFQQRRTVMVAAMQ